MSLSISNIDYLSRVLGISTTKIQQDYDGMSVDEIVKAEASSGNQLAIEMANEILNNPEFLIELFQLADASNKILIMQQMTSAQLEEMLPQMDSKDLMQGLNFFSLDKLMDMMEDVPPEQLVKSVLQMFSKEQIMLYMPEDQLDKFLTDTDFDKNKILKHMKSIPNEYLAQVLESITGESVDEKTNSADLIGQMSELNPLDFQNAMLNFQPTQKQQMVLSMCKEHEEWMQKFDAGAYTQIMSEYKQKPEIIQSMQVIDDEEIVKMVEQLPKDLLQIVISQMDTKEFAEQLMDKNPEVIAKILAS